MLVLAPSRSPQLVRESRRLIRSARENPSGCSTPTAACGCSAVGELLPLSGAAALPAPPVDVARTIEEVLTLAPLDFVHVHEPFAPSASSVALRHSRALNVGSFHAPTERVVSTQVARRFVELFFGRLDARTASFGATRELMERFFPAATGCCDPARRRSSGRRATGRCGSRSAPRRSARRCGCSCARCGGCPTSSRGRRRCSRRPAPRPPARCAAACATG